MKTLYFVIVVAILALWAGSLQYPIGPVQSAPGRCMAPPDVAFTSIQD